MLNNSSHLFSIQEFVIGVEKEFQKIGASVIRYSTDASVEISLKDNFRDHLMRKIDFVSGGRQHITCSCAMHCLSLSLQ